MTSVVWILGAGFSRSLGGPLLTDLLGTAATDRVTACYPQNPYRLLHDEGAETVRSLFRYFGPRAAPGERRWEDAEQFLDALDAVSTARDHTAPGFMAMHSLVTQFGHSGNYPLIRSLATSGRRLMAAECSAFLEECDTATERWDPYRRWARLLRAPHVAGPQQVTSTVITFNYDRVVEIAAQAERVEIAPVLPSANPSPNEHTTYLGRTNLLKLHGSVDWRRKPESGGYEVASPLHALNCPDEELVIATPGPRKRKVASEDLCELWAAAVHAIKWADAIVFVGYRFPPSDSEARRRLLDAITANEVRHLFVHTILGPNRSDPASARMTGMLHFALRRRERTLRDHPGTYQRYTLNQHPLYAEDFLDLFDARDLTMRHE